ncbi:septum site-determining protein Ssd [Antrihabitans stalactiti]|uniref:Rv3660c-like CheY-like N-terminal domain-containing protein n=1 Tax=Antrihabitans stalactiti TaxID=2584121 RepID=A0A848KJJ1_9NOCA|nr:septum site-determining protein Ssd [Antrihabitans stalactiti]NMN96852.1 hypothetical protein [Antrihabitans stalactiti]
MDLDQAVSRPTPRVAMLVHDADLRGEIRRIAAAADVVLDEIAGAVGRQLWQAPHVVVVDTPTAQSLILDRMPRRRGVVLVCSSSPDLNDWETASALGAEHVIGLPKQEFELVEVFGARSDADTGGGPVIAIVGGRGGAGASTFAAALAVFGASTRYRADTLLIDVDSAGGGIDLLLGAEHVPGLRWPSLVLEGGRVSPVALHNALPSAAPGLTVLACGRGEFALDPNPAAVSAVIEAGSSAGNLVVGDVPRRPSDAGDAFLDAADLVVIVVPAELRASAAAEAVVARVAAHSRHSGLVVRGPAPGGLRGSDIAAALGVPILAAVRPEPRLADLLERGGLRLRRRSPLRVAAAAVLAAVEDRTIARGRAA